MKRDLQGRYVTISTVGEKAQAFVPAPLPPRPPIDWTPELRSKFDQALLALGRLDSASTLLPDTSLFLYLYVCKEAVLSSMIEGTLEGVLRVHGRAEIFNTDQGTPFTSLGRGYRRPSAL
jgi:hypothetical protein